MPPQSPSSYTTTSALAALRTKQLLTQQEAPTATLAGSGEGALASTMPSAQPLGSASQSSLSLFQLAAKLDQPAGRSHLGISKGRGIPSDGLLQMGLSTAPASGTRQPGRPSAVTMASLAALRTIANVDLTAPAHLQPQRQQQHLRQRQSLALALGPRDDRRQEFQR